MGRKKGGVIFFVLLLLFIFGYEAVVLAQTGIEKNFFKKNKDRSFTASERAKSKVESKTGQKKKMPYVSDLRKLNLSKETIKGLQVIGYNLDEIVDNLIKEGNSAHLISMALLSTGDYSGKEIYNSLKKSGSFNDLEVEAAVPVGIRHERQFFAPKVKKEIPKYNKAAQQVIIYPNPLTQDK